MAGLCFSSHLASVFVILLVCGYFFLFILFVFRYFFWLSLFHIFFLLCHTADKIEYITDKKLHND